MKKTGNIIYIILCLVICILPFAGMAVYKTESTTENKKLAEFPQWSTDGKWNKEYFNELSAYFEDHFSFRQELVSADAMIQSKIFKVSNVDTVLVGENDWLFYTDTLNDYLRQHTMNNRQVFNTVHNISLLQQYVLQEGADFIFTVAPNKNSLYPENMPYYNDYQATDTKNMDLLPSALKDADIRYVDLYAPFERSNEILYLKRDSHWNNKGAILAYNTMMDYLMMPHETYEVTEATREEKAYGDLNKMLYPLTAKPEWDYDYGVNQNWTYVSEEQDVEAAFIETKSDNGTGSLLMFRDSFGNTLLPLMARQFENATFSKAVPYHIGELMESVKPEVVIVEKVERNLDEYMTKPPIMQGVSVDVEDVQEAYDESTSTLQFEESMEDTNYYVVSGVWNGDVTEDMKMYLRLRNEEQEYTFECFTITTELTDYGYQMYVSKDVLESLRVVKDDKLTIDLLVEQNGVCQAVNTKEIALNQIGE